MQQDSTFNIISQGREENTIAADGGKEFAKPWEIA